MKTRLIRLVMLTFVFVFGFRSAHAQYPWEGAGAPGRVLFIEQFYNDTIEDCMYAVGQIDLNSDFVINDNTVLRYRNSVWDTLGIFDNRTLSIILWHDTLVVGGGFTTVSGLAAEGIVCYANGQWHPYGVIPGGGVFKLRVVNDELYALGSFTSIDGHACRGVAKRDGSEWVNVGLFSDPDGFILVDILSYNGALIACGDVSPDGDEDGGVIRFDGNSWTPLGGGIVGGQGTTMAVYKGELYVGGLFPIGPNPGKSIMRWNGMEWRSLGIGPQIINGSYQYNYQMEDLEVHDDALCMRWFQIR
ncbi:MAG: hypothetical protein IPP33_11770 [Flavobacteriales bacterium]|nr:hypothetical protein [Flavobacteriales bacterium]